VKSLDYVRWAREEIPARGLDRSEAQVLQALASWAGRDGCCCPGVERIAEVSVLSSRQTHRALRCLEQRQMVCTTRRGRGRSARRRLLVEAPVEHEQLALDFTAARVDTHSPAVSDVPLATSDVPSGGTQKEQTEGADNSGGGGREEPEMVLSPALSAVLEVLEAAPGLMVEPMAVDSALRAFPAGEHVEAAYVVASYAHEGGLRVPAANRLLLAELRKQRDRKLTAASRPHSGRRRRRPSSGPLEAPEVTAERHARQDAAIDALLARRGFGVKPSAEQAPPVRVAATVEVLP